MKRKPKKISCGGQGVRIQPRTVIRSGVEYDCWQIFWREEGRARSTTRQTEEEAKILAAEIALRLAKGEIKQLILTGLNLADYEKASKLCSDTGGTLLEAARFYAAEWQKRQIREINVPDLVKEFLQAKKDDGLTDRYLNDARLRLKRFAKEHDRPIHTITSRELDDYLRRLGHSIRSRNNVHTILGSLFTYAQARGYLPASERTAPAILPRAKTKPSVIGIITPKNFAAVLSAATRKTLPAFVLGGFCGIRQAEICRLDWSAIDFDRKIITVNASIAKTSRRRLVPFHDAAAAWLAPIAKKSGPVIEYSSPINLSIMMRPIWKAAKVKNTQNCLRHSGASYRLAGTGNAPETALELGTSVEMLMRHYRELVTKEDAKTWFATFPETKESAGQENPQTGPQYNPPTENDQEP